MIEAVNSAVANAAVVRASAEAATAVTRSYAANPDRIQESAGTPKAPYISPFIHLDLDYDKAVLLIRDAETGDVVRQFPSESALESRRRAVALQQNQQLAQQAAPKNVSAPSGDVHNFDSSSSSVGVSAPAQNAQAQVAAAALESSAQVGTSSSGNFSTSA